MWTWGCNSHSQLGLKDTTADVDTPTHVTSLDQHIVVMVSGGNRHSIAVASDGQLLTFGSGKGTVYTTLLRASHCIHLYYTTPSGKSLAEEVAIPFKVDLILLDTLRIHFCCWMLYSSSSSICSYVLVCQTLGISCQQSKAALCVSVCLCVHLLQVPTVNWATVIE